MKVLLECISAIGFSYFEHCLLWACADVCRVNHLLKSTPLILLDDVLQQMDLLLFEAAERLFGKTLEPVHLRQVFLPIEYGGLGVRSPTQLGEGARVAAICSYARDFNLTFVCDLI